MNEQELVDKVRKLVYGDAENEPIPVESVRENSFLDQPQYRDLQNDFNTSPFRKGNKWNWHQFVDMSIEPPEIRQEMYQRTLSLLSDFGNSYKKYFILKTDAGLFHVPNSLSDLNRIKIVSEEYFKIYENIISRIHFDHPKEEQVGRIKGKINWGKTIRTTSSKFPINFVTSLSKKNFKTPENILLVLCAYWILNESDRLLKTNFNTTLTVSSKIILSNIFRKSKFILQKFPFNEVLDISKQYWDFSYDPPTNEIKNLELNTKKRILQGTIKNPYYFELMKWIQKFRDLGIKSFDKQSPTQNILESLKNVDTIYEIWIFMEFVTYVKEKGYLKKFELGEIPKCTIAYDGSEITFWYGKNFIPRDGIVWAKHHNPDFVAQLNDIVLGVFDAKNYSLKTPRGETQDKILAYLNNFDTNFGALIYPNYPEDWNRKIEPELESNENLEKRQQDILDIKISFWNNFPNINSSERKSMLKDILLVPWNDLKDQYKKLIPRSIQIINQNQPERKNRFHFEQTVAYVRMNPENTISSIDAKNKTLEYIFNRIVNGVNPQANLN